MLSPPACTSSVRVLSTHKGHMDAGRVSRAYSCVLTPRLCPAPSHGPSTHPPTSPWPILAPLTPGPATPATPCCRPPQEKQQMVEELKEQGLLPTQVRGKIGGGAAGRLGNLATTSVYCKGCLSPTAPWHTYPWMRILSSSPRRHITLTLGTSLATGYALLRLMSWATWPPPASSCPWRWPRWTRTRGAGGLPISI